MRSGAVLLSDNSNNISIQPSSSFVDSMTPKSPLISRTSENSFQVSEFGFMEQIGTGQYGRVYKAVHVPTQQTMAIKKTLSTREQYNELSCFWDFLLDLNATRSQGREYIVDFLGTIFFDSDCWLCMELMDLSLDKFAEFVYSLPDDYIPEFVVAQIARSMVLALKFLESNSYKLRRKSYCEKMLRNGSNNGKSAKTSTPFADVKTSNVLISRSGDIKLCDLGMCRRLIDPSASSQGGESFHYIAPERICPGAGATTSPSDSFDVQTDSRADVWAVGISLFEITTGVLPFRDVIINGGPFQVINAIVNGPSPKLEPVNDRRSNQLASFVNYCLVKNVSDRPTYHDLLFHDFLINATAERDVAKLASYFSTVLNLIDAKQQIMLERQAEENRRRLSSASRNNKANTSSSSSSNRNANKGSVTLPVSS